MVTRTQAMTAAELVQLSRDGWRYELVKGELHKMAPAGFEHGTIVQRLAGRLGQYVETHDLGVVLAAETGFLIGTDPDTVRAPDVAFVCAARVAALGVVKSYWPGAPDLAAEVVSPGDSYSAVTEKALAWLEAGAHLVLVVDPRQRTVTVYRARTQIAVLTAPDTLDGGEVVPGWTLPVRELFP